MIDPSALGNLFHGRDHYRVSVDDLKKALAGSALARARDQRMESGFIDEKDLLRESRGLADSSLRRLSASIADPSTSQILRRIGYEPDALRSMLGSPLLGGSRGGGLIALDSRSAQEELSDPLVRRLLSSLIQYGGRTSPFLDRTGNRYSVPASAVLGPAQSLLLGNLLSDPAGIGMDPTSGFAPGFLASPEGRALSGYVSQGGDVDEVNDLTRNLRLGGTARLPIKGNEDQRAQSILAAEVIRAIRARNDRGMLVPSADPGISYSRYGGARAHVPAMHSAMPNPSSGNLVDALVTGRISSILDDATRRTGTFAGSYGGLVPGSGFGVVDDPGVLDELMRLDERGVLDSENLSPRGRAILEATRQDARSGNFMPSIAALESALQEGQRPQYPLDPSARAPTPPLVPPMLRFGSPQVVPQASDIYDARKDPLRHLESQRYLAGLREPIERQSLSDPSVRERRRKIAADKAPPKKFRTWREAFTGRDKELPPLPPHAYRTPDPTIAAMDEANRSGSAGALNKYLSEKIRSAFVSRKDANAGLMDPDIIRMTGLERDGGGSFFLPDKVHGVTFNADVIKRIEAVDEGFFGRHPEIKDLVQRIQARIPISMTGPDGERLVLPPLSSGTVNNKQAFLDQRRSYESGKKARGLRRADVPMEERAVRGLMAELGIAPSAYTQEGYEGTIESMRRGGSRFVPGYSQEDDLGVRKTSVMEGSDPDPEAMRRLTKGGRVPVATPFGARSSGDSRDLMMLAAMINGDPRLIGYSRWNAQSRRKLEEVLGGVDPFDAPASKVALTKGSRLLDMDQAMSEGFLLTDKDGNLDQKSLDAFRKQYPAVVGKDGVTRYRIDVNPRSAMNPTRVAPGLLVEQLMGLDQPRTTSADRVKDVSGKRQSAIQRLRTIASAFRNATPEQKSRIMEIMSSDMTPEQARTSLLGALGGIDGAELPQGRNVWSSGGRGDFRTPGGVAQTTGQVRRHLEEKGVKVPFNPPRTASAAAARKGSVSLLQDVDVPRGDEQAIAVAGSRGRSSFIDEVESIVSGSKDRVIRDSVLQDLAKKHGITVEEVVSSMASTQRRMDERARATGGRRIPAFVDERGNPLRSIEGREDMSSAPGRIRTTQDKSGRIVEGGGPKARISPGRKEGIASKATSIAEGGRPGSFKKAIRSVIQDVGFGGGSLSDFDDIADAILRNCRNLSPEQCKMLAGKVRAKLNSLARRPSSSPVGKAGPTSRVLAGGLSGRGGARLGLVSIAETLKGLVK